MTQDLTNVIITFFIVKAVLTILSMLFIVLSALEVIGRWKMFKKFDVDPWKSLIPFYGTWSLNVKCSDKKQANSVLIASLVACFLYFICCGSTKNTFLLGSVFSFLGISLVTYTILLYECNKNIAKNCGKGIAFAILMTLLRFATDVYLGFFYKKPQLEPQEEAIQESQDPIEPISIHEVKEDVKEEVELTEAQKEVDELIEKPIKKPKLPKKQKAAQKEIEDSFESKESEGKSNENKA